MAGTPIVIAHRGASGYFPEHTLPAKAIAHAMGADYLEQDIVLTRDDVPIVLHDIHLDTVTDVATRYADRRRDDGRYYAIDFTLDEIRQLRIHERINLRTGQPVYGARFPAQATTCQIPTLDEELQFIKGLNHSTGRVAGIYPEIKAPSFHRRAGKDISRIVLDVLARHGYTTPDSLAYVQCFDPTETRRLRESLGTRLRLIQLIGENSWKEAETDFDALRTAAGLREIAEYANGIGPSIEHVVHGRTDDGKPRITSLVADAHGAGLEVHPYTARWDDVPAFAPDADWLVSALFADAHVDGLFTDFPDRAMRIGQSMSERPN